MPGTHLIFEERCRWRDDPKPEASPEQPEISRETGFLGVSVKRMYAGQHGQDPGHSSRTAFPDKLVYGQFDGQTPKSRTAPRAAAGAKNKKASVVLAVAVVRFED